MFNSYLVIFLLFIVLIQGDLSSRYAQKNRKLNLKGSKSSQIQYILLRIMQNRIMLKSKTNHECDLRKILPKVIFDFRKNFTSVYIDIFLGIMISNYINFLKISLINVYNKLNGGLE